MILLRYIILATALIGCLATATDAEPRRRMAVTFDDLPIGGGVAKTAGVSRKITLRLLHQLAERDIPAIGFVNESKLYSGGEPDGARVDLLRLWLAAGMDLGNHTFSHPDLHRTDLQTFRQDIVDGETVLKQLLFERGAVPEYFRHPFLHTGTSLDTKRSVDTFLANTGYTVAPVTIDNSEWIFALAYDLALQDGDVEGAKQIGLDYIEYMLQVTAFYEDQSNVLFDRNIDHILLLHANELNSQLFGVLADRLRKIGYEFITLKESLLDPAYQSKDTYTGNGGITWLHRWALSSQVDPSMFRGEPETPKHILELAGM